jgi:trehalose utilization protein
VSACYLESQTGLDVKLVEPDDAGGGMADEVPDACDVLIWRGRVRKEEISPEAVPRVVDRIVGGRHSPIALHSTH